MIKLSKIPLSALSFKTKITKTTDDKSDLTPIKLNARSSKPIKHPYWGICVHDMTGLILHKNRLAIDYNHDPDQIIGFLDTFKAQKMSGLNVSGYLLTHDQKSKASEIVNNLKKGIPYEASINFGGDDLELEIVDEGFSAKVNGYEIKGPAVIFRKWNLRGVAICPCGADQNTKTELLSGKTVSLKSNKIKFTGNDLEFNNQLPEHLAKVARAYKRENFNAC